jgi:RNA polymerase sigma-70 factor, ECF subfamily
LVAIAYNMIGQIHEAEDIVQDAFEDVIAKGEREVKNSKSYLTRIVMNKAIDRLGRLKVQREHYPALWLPEPYISEDERSTEADILPYAILHLIEQLNPLERAVFILREAFNYSYEDIAEICNITTDNCRQILHRSKLKLKDTTVQGAKKEQDDRILKAFLRACLSNDTEALASLLKEDVLLYADGGGKVVAARKILDGIASVSKFLFGIVRKTVDKWSAAKQVAVNGQPGLIMKDGEGIYMVLVPHIVEGKVLKIFIMRNPDKIFFKNSVTN